MGKPRWVFGRDGCGVVVEEAMSRHESTDPIIERQRLARHYLGLLPQPTEREWDDLSEWEQSFLTSVRAQFARKGDVSEKQYEILDTLYRKYN